MTVDPGTTPHRVELGDRTYWFCSAACRDSFEAEPDRHLSRDSTAGRS
jgi:P-type Cu+ transporter